MITIRKTNKNDIDILMKIRLEMLKEVNKLSNDYMFSNDLIENAKNYFLSGSQTTVIAEENGNVIGCASISYITIMPTFSHPSGKRAHLMNVYTDRKSVL